MAEEEQEVNLAICPRCKNPIPESEEEKPIIECAYCRLFFNNPVFNFENQQEFIKIPDIKLRWVRGQEWIRFTIANLFLILGKKGAGKSNLLEVLAIRYPKIIDILGAIDGESLAWCKPEFAKVWKAIHGVEPRILLLHGQTKKVVCRWFTMSIDKLTLQTFSEYDIIILYCDFFADEEDHFNAMFTLIDILLKQRKFWTEPWYLMIREAADFIYARMKIIKDDKMAKAELVRLMRQMRHVGVALGIDTLRWTAIDKEGRDHADYTFIKKPGRPNLPDELRFIYKFFSLFIRKMKSDRFIMISSEENIGIGKCDYAPWHKTEKENIFKDLEISVVEAETGKVDREDSYSSPDLVHAQCVEAYNKTKSSQRAERDTGMNHQTILNHVNLHNALIKRFQVCKKCKNAQSELASVFIEKAPYRKGRQTTKRVPV